MDTESSQTDTTRNNTVPSSVTAGTAHETIVVPQESIRQESFFARNKSTLIALIIALVFLGGAGYYFYSTKFMDTTVAIVNGTKIYKTEFDESVTLMEQNAAQQGLDLTDEAARMEIRNQALETLINNALIVDAAKASGVAASDAEIQVKYDELITQLGGIEILNTKMAEIGLTEEKLRSNIKERILADAYIEAETDIESIIIDDAEIATFIDTIKKQSPEGTELPPLEEIKPQIQAQLTAQKQQQIVTDLIAKLRAEAKIEMKI